MKKIIVTTKKIPPVAAQTIVTIETVLHGQELVAYKTQVGGNICLLQRLAKEPAQRMYGFCNIGYSNSGPSFISDNWHGAIKLAATAQREIFAFDNYQELLAWIAHDFIGGQEKHAAQFVVGQKVLVADGQGAIWLRRYFYQKGDNGTCYATNTSDKRDGFFHWKMCIPYDERLEGTIVR